MEWLIASFLVFLGGIVLVMFDALRHAAKSSKSQPAEATGGL